MQPAQDGGSSRPLWNEYRAKFQAMRDAKSVKPRTAAFADAVAFMGNAKHRACVHKWRGWSLLFDGFLAVVRSDVFTYMGIDDGVEGGGRKRKTQTTAKSKAPPKLTRWTYLRNEFASAHQIDGPMLHLDPNGRDCVIALFTFTLTVINHVGGEERDPAKRTVRSEIERAAWQTIELIVTQRVYCALLTQDQLQETLELALAGIDFGDSSRQGAFPDSSNDLVVLASVIHLVLTRTPYDRHGWLEMLVPFLSNWFKTLAEKETHPFAAIATKIIETVTDVGRAHFTFIGELLLPCAMPLLQYTMRTWKKAPVYWRVKLAAFLTLYIELFEYHADSLVLEGDLNPKKLLKVAKALLAIFIDTKALQSLSVSSRASAMNSAISVATTTTSTGICLSLDAPTVSSMVCTADMIYFHDRLLQRLSVLPTTRANQDHGEEVKDPDEPMSLGLVSPAKRSFEATLPMAWEQLVHDILADSSDANSSSSSSVPQSQSRREQFVQRQKNRAFQHLLDIRLLLLTAVLRRHGDFYAGERIGDLVNVMDFVTQSLEVKEIDKQQGLILHILVQVADLSQGHPDLKSELFEDFWIKIWDVLLRPGMPYAAELRLLAPQHGVGELVFTILNGCISLGLVPQAVVTRSSEHLWTLYRPHSSATALAVPASDSVSKAPIAFLATLMQLTQPPSSIEVQEEDEQDLAPSSVRSRVLQAMFDHLQAMMLVEVNKPEDSRWQATFDSHETGPAVYAAALSSFLGVTTTSLRGASLAGDDLKPSLLRSFDESDPGSSVPGSPDVEGFGAHFTLQEWGIPWMLETSSYIKTRTSVAHDPDRFSPLVQLFRPSRRTADSTNIAAGTRADWERSNGFARLHISDRLARRHVIVDHQKSAFDAVLAKNSRNTKTAPLSVSRKDVELSMSETTKMISTILDDLSKKMTFADVDSPYYLKLLDSTITVGLMLACLFAEAKEGMPSEFTSERGDVTSEVCVLLKRFLGLFSDHFSARAIDHARDSAMMTSSVTRLLMNFHAFILVLQGRQGLQQLTHPCADPLDLKIASELRLAIRKLASAVETSLQLISMDSDEPNSATLGSPTPSTPASFDWGSTSQTSQSKEARTPGSSAAIPFDVDGDEDDIEGTDSSTKTGRWSHPSRVLSLWSLRVLLLLKRETGIKAVKTYYRRLGFTPDFLVATASMLCGISGCDSLDTFVKILAKADDEMSQGKQRIGSPALMLFYASDVMQVLQRCALMYESRKRLHKEEIPESLLQFARRFLSVCHQSASRSRASFARRAEIEALETFFRVNTDAFGDFVDTAMQGILDVDVSVRFSSAKSLQTIFYMYPDGGKPVFRDLRNKVLSRLLPPNARASRAQGEDELQDDSGCNISSMETCLTVLATLYVCACSSSDVVPDVVLIFTQLAGNGHVAVYTQSGLLKAWLEQIAVWYDYPSPTQLVDDHFRFLWSHHVKSFINTGSSTFIAKTDEKAEIQRTTAKKLLETFPVEEILVSSSQERRRDASSIFQRHLDVIMPLCVLYDVACGDAVMDGSHFLLVDDMTRELMWKNLSAQEASSGRQQLLALTQEQLTTDLFALSFVMHSLSLDGNTRAEEIGASMLAIAEDMALTHALSISHLGHVVMKMVRFTVWNILSESHRSTDSSFECEADHWLRAMKTMKEKYTGFDWARMNLAELLSEFHELLLRTVYYEPTASRAIECFCLFVNEIKDAITVADLKANPNAVLLQHLLLHVMFETVKNVKRRDRKSSRKLTFLVREVCDHFMKNSSDAFGKYLNFVVQEIADILVRASRKVDALFLEGDDAANLEWVIFAICNNMASGLGKFMVDVEAVPSGIATCLDKLNSMLATSTDSKNASTGKRRRSLDPSISLGASSSATDSSRVNALHQIEQFIVRASKVGERFYQPRTVVSGGGIIENATKDDSSLSDAAGMSSQLQLLREHVRVIRRIEPADSEEAGSGEIKSEIAAARRTVLAKLARTLLTLSTHYEEASGEQGTASQADQLLLAIADILGEIGVWDVQDFNLSPGQNGEELSRLYQRHFRRGALRDTKANFRAQMHEQLLQYLSSLMFESGSVSSGSADVLHDALNTIKKVLGVSEVSNVLAKTKDAELHNFLDAFIEAPPSNWSLAALPVVSGATNRSSRMKALWRSVDSVSFEDWICPLTQEMTSQCIDTILRACGPLAGRRIDMAVFVFPYVLWAILKNKESDPRLAVIVNENLRSIIQSASAANRTYDDRVLQLLIHSINFLRETEKAVFVEGPIEPISQKLPKTPTKNGSSHVVEASAHLNQPAYSCLVEIDLLGIAEAAICVNMPYSAMQFAEMWLEINHGGVLPSLSSVKTGSDDSRIRSILVDAFSFDDDVDGIYGVNDGRTFASQLVTYNREGNFGDSLPLYDTMLQLGRGNAGSVEGFLHALNRLGYQHLLRGQLNSFGDKVVMTPKIQEHRHELAWKSLQWNSVEIGVTPASAQTLSFKDEEGVATYLHQRTLYQTLKALADRDVGQLTRLSSAAKQQILKSTRTSLFGMESTRESSAALLQLQSIHEIEECGKIAAASASSGGISRASLSQLFVDWQRRRDFQSKNDYDASEALLSLEEVLARVVELPTPNATLASIYLSLAARSRRAGRVAIAYKSLTKLEELHQQGLLELDVEAEWKTERAKLLWRQRETRSAIWVAQQLHHELQSRMNTQGTLLSSQATKLRMLYVESLTLTGKWIASQRSENSQVILQDYLHKATEMVDAMSEHELRAAPSGVQAAAKAHFALADYMAEMYQQVAARVSSREWLAGKRVAEARQRELAECLAMNEAKQLENRAHIHALNKEVQYDYEERTKVEASVDQFLGGAVRSFGKGLSLSAKSELAVVFRVLSLWFSNQTKPGVNRAMQEIVDSVPSYKFVPLSYQIISRVGSNPTSTSTTSGDGGSVFERVLSMLVLKLCEQHPHHALVQLLALKNSGDVEGKGALQFRANVGDAKAESARKYLEKLRKGEQRELLESLDVLSNAYVQLALSDTREHHKNGKNISFAKAPITTFGGGGTVQFDHCLRDRSRRSASRAVMPAVLTSSIPARPDMDYSSVSRVLSFDPKFSITDSGIHRPKIIHCIGSDGRRFKQLVKGKDDTRQDLVIEQVFDSVNQFLKDDNATRERNLRLRTYKVVPLSPIAGVLEWVDNTVPWGSYLVARSGKRLSAHERYHPHEWKHADCRMYLKNATHDKLSAYKDVEAHFTPVFHHFFLEKYPDPAMWFKRRLAYVQSVAVTSIVGYILGIGDRHSQNILIHEETAELVHIDFGVVFDQGMALFTPETVPFRLTRDIVDGMGVSGVEGVFSRCCEATLQLLRKKSASVVTILEVFVHDPLYRWTLSPLKALKIQEEGHHTVQTASTKTGSETDDTSSDPAENGVAGNNDAAARALIRVKQKLEGYEDPNGNALSIEGQVKQLISAAQDPHNLCSLFPGWAPWL